MTKQEWWKNLKNKKPDLADQLKDWPEFAEVLFNFQGMVIDAKVIKHDEEVRSN